MGTSCSSKWRRGVRGEVVPTVGASGGRRRRSRRRRRGRRREQLIPAVSYLPLRQSLPDFLLVRSSAPVQTFTTNTRSVTTKAPAPCSSALPPAVILKGRVGMKSELK